MCSGCILYLDAPEGTKLRGSREVTHTGAKFLCRTPWKLDASKADGYFGDNKVEAVQEYIQKQHGISAGRIAAVQLFTPSASSPEVQLSDKEEETSPLSQPTELSTAAESDGRTVAKPRGDIELHDEIISSFGHEFEIKGIPVTHCIVTKALLERLRGYWPWRQLVRLLHISVHGELWDIGNVLQKSGVDSDVLESGLVAVFNVLAKLLGLPFITLVGVIVGFFEILLKWLSGPCQIGGDGFLEVQLKWLSGPCQICDNGGNGSILLFRQIHRVSIKRIPE
jgi:hypothetical protein